MSAPGYGGRPAARQAAVKASARAGTIPMAAQYPRELKDGGNALKLGFDRTARFAAFAASLYRAHWKWLMARAWYPAKASRSLGLSRNARTAQSMARSASPA